MGLSSEKLNARLALHARMGEPCTYSVGATIYPTEEQTAAGLELTARFHTKSKISTGDDSSMSVMEPIERLVFSETQLAALDLTLEGGAEIYFPGYNIRVELDQQLDPDGPENVYWTVTRA